MNKNLVLIALALSTWGVGEGMFYFFQPLYLQQLGADPVKIGAILGIVGVAMGIAHLPAGYLADRFGRRPLLITAWVWGLLATGVMAVASSLPLFVLGMSLYGVTAFVSGPLNSYITAERGQWSVSRALTLISASFSVGAVIGPLMGGWIGEHLGLRASFRFAFIMFIVSTSLIVMIRPQPVESGHNKNPSASFEKVFNFTFVRFIFLVFGIFFLIYLPQPLAQNYLQNERGVSLANIGFLLSARGFGVVLLNLLIGSLDAGLGLVVSQAAMILFSIFMWTGSNMPAYLLGYAMLGSSQTARLMLMAKGRGLVGAEHMGLAYGALETTLALVAVLAPPLAGALYAIRPDLVFPISGIGIAISTLAGWLWLPKSGTDRTNASSPKLAE